MFSAVPLYASLVNSYASTRLFILLPAEFEDSIEGNLLAVNLDDSPHYEALSYVWGDAGHALTVTIAGQLVVVTDNLHAALRRLRYRDRERVLWVDALCINQSDVKEKGQQIDLMGRIYKGSLQCLVWLGEISTGNHERLRITTQDVEAAYEMIRLIADGELEGDLPATLSSGTARKGAASALRGMMSRENMWWQRIWTVQEATLSSRKTVLWHTVSISWSKCVQAAKRMMEPSTRQRKVIDALSPELYSFDVNEFITPFLSLELNNEDTNPLFTAHRWRYREATDPRDKVYGLLSLIDRAHLPSISCDYRLSAASVFTKLTLDLINSTQSLVPSIGWRVNHGCKFWEHYDRYYYFSADGYSELVLNTLCDESVLVLKGLIVDTVCLVDEGIAVDESVVLPNEDFARLIKRRQQVLAKFIEDSPEKSVLGNDWKNAFWRTMLGDVVTYDERVTRRAVPDDAKLFDQFLEDWQWNEVSESLRSMALNQAFFITRSGYLGIGPPHTRSGDVVCVLLGGRVPFILRPEEGNLTLTETMASIADSVIHQLETVKLVDQPSVVFVDDTAAVSKLVDVLDSLPTDKPSIFIDLEGVNLSRHGTISIMQIYDHVAKRTYLVDVYILGSKCFSTPGSNGRTLKQILESATIPKVFFDVRNDSDALYGNYQIDLAGIHDLQLMELATRTFSRRCVTGLSKCIEKDAPLSFIEIMTWMRTKEKGLHLFAPEKGGSYEVFNKRPLPEDIKLYCAQDVQILPRLWVHYNAKMGSRWREKVMAESKARVRLSQMASFNGKGRHMALAPVGWEYGL
ncbi:hypothetical protein ACHAPJ_013109 [Fusarium lateritium]